MRGACCLLFSWVCFRRISSCTFHRALPSAFQSHLPFAVVGSTEEVKIGNKMVKARQYPWGTVQGKPGLHPVQEMKHAPSWQSCCSSYSLSLLVELGSSSCCKIHDCYVTSLSLRTVALCTGEAATCFVVFTFKITGLKMGPYLFVFCYAFCMF